MERAVRSLIIAMVAAIMAFIVFVVVMAVTAFVGIAIFIFEILSQDVHLG